MIDSEPVLRARLAWVQHYANSRDAGLTCRRCGISRPTLRKWWRRFQEHGEAGLASVSRRRHTLPEPKVTPEHELTILKLRKERRLGPHRLQSELRRTQSLSLSTATLWKVLHRSGAKSLRKPPRRPDQPKRYSRPVPGERVQIDNCKIGKGLHQFTAVDDCTRMRVIRLYDGRTAASAVHFLTERVLKQFPFPIQRIQTDRGTEFFAYGFQDALQAHKIKFRPIRPLSPHLNGKVERSQQTDRVEFWDALTLENPNPADADLVKKHAEWQTYYNTERVHGALRGKTPQERFEELKDSLPTTEQIAAEYASQVEPARCVNYNLDRQLFTLLRVKR